MVRLTRGRDVGDDPELFDEVFRFRHRFFVDRMRWEALRKPDGREVDQFDTDDCLHLVGMDEGAVVSYTRLLPTTQPHLLDTVYPEILGGLPAPTGPHVWEWTRFAVEPAKREGRVGTDPTTAEMYLAVTETCLRFGIAALLIETHPIYLTRILELGWQARPLTLPLEYDGQPVIAIYAGVSETTLERTRQAFGIRTSVLEDETGRPERVPVPPAIRRNVRR